MRLISAVHWALCEALRRFELFAVRQDGKKWNLDDLQKAWTGLGPATARNYGPVLDAGFMCRVPGNNPNYPHPEWFCLTRKGAQVVLHWHNLGFNCGTGSDLTETPSRLVSDTVFSEENNKIAQPNGNVEMTADEALAVERIRKIGDSNLDVVRVLAFVRSVKINTLMQSTDEEILEVLNAF